jgi:glycosyltransferase involved in cell wall biosynthesis
MLAVEHGEILNLHSVPPRRRLRVRVERRLCAHTNYSDIAVSDTMLEVLQQTTGRTCARRIYNGVDLRHFRPAAQPEHRSKITIGVASRLVPGKGIETLLSACALLGSACPWQLRIAGEGPDAARLRAFTNRDPRMRDRVDFVGMVADISRFWVTCDVAVVPTSQLRESFSMAAVEAMACGLPIIASRAGALPEICGDSCGILVPPGDVEALAAALTRYLSDPDLRRAYGIAGRQRVEQQFDIERMVDQYLDALDDAGSPVGCDQLATHLGNIRTIGDSTAG